jgi:hypothetical protein
VGAENREGSAHVGERYLLVTGGSPLHIGAQRGGLGGGWQFSCAYADVSVTYVDLIDPSEFENNVRQELFSRSVIVE